MGMTMRVVSFVVVLAGCAIGLAGAIDQAGSAKAANPAAGVGGEVQGELFLDLRTGRVDTARPVGGLEKLAGIAKGPLVIQLTGPMRPAWRARLEAAGVRLGDYLPNNAWIAWVDRADGARVAGLEFVRWHSPFQDSWKIEPGIGTRDYVEPARLELAKAGRVAVVVTLFDGARSGPVAEAIQRLPGGAVYWRVELDGNETISAALNADQVAVLAQRPDVQFIEDAPDVAPRNDSTRWIIQSNINTPAPFLPLWDAGLHGEGQVLGLLDTKLDRNHCAFSDTQPIGPLHRKIVAYNTSLGASSHGTHVCGTSVGDNGTGANRGMAYLGKVAYNDIPSFGEAPVFNSLTTHHGQGARVHTNSWGNDGTTAYDAMCRGFDNFQWLNEDDIVTLAVTNLSQLKNPENAKNLLAVGNCADAPSQGNHCTGGTGPTADGRRKPEIYAPGCNTNSAASGTACGTSSLTGTSMATPAVAGIAMLTHQYFMDGFYPGGVSGGGEAFTPSGALVKAMLLNSAVDMTGITGYPSNQEGWGRLLADNALFFSGDARKLVVQDVRHAQGLVTAGSASTAVAVLSSSQPLKITLVYCEPPGAANAANPVINDLDLVVTAPDGTEYKGNVFAAGQSAPGGTRDTKNNVEQVHLTSPVPGSWTVQVNGAAVNQAIQGYALVITGDVQGGPAGMTIALDGAVPGLVAPATPVNVNVRVRPGDDTVVAGSEMFHYRLGPSDPFTSVPLTLVSGDLYTATVPAAACASAPQFYASAEGITTGVRTTPPNAPTNTYAYEIGVVTTTTVMTEHFAGLPPGWATTGMWHLSSGCAVNPLCDGPSWMAYNQESTCLFNGGTSTGDLTSAPITLPS
ncbi:MAG TPA: S8 family serine peptidase, partial [Phycisphaerales bacterium]|nr:S8 family serine peptidase [Phycisphaerales bacterium]